MWKLLFVLSLILALPGCATLGTIREAANAICDKQDEFRLAAIVGLKSSKPAIVDASEFMLKALEACPPLEE